MNIKDWLRDNASLVIAIVLLMICIIISIWLFPQMNWKHW